MPNFKVRALLREHICIYILEVMLIFCIFLRKRTSGYALAISSEKDMLILPYSENYRRNSEMTWEATRYNTKRELTRILIPLVCPRVVHPLRDMHICLSIVISRSQTRGL